MFHESVKEKAYQRSLSFIKLAFKLRRKKAHCAKEDVKRLIIHSERNGRTEH